MHFIQSNTRLDKKLLAAYFNDSCFDYHDPAVFKGLSEVQKVTKLVDLHFAAYNRCYNDYTPEEVVVPPPLPLVAPGINAVWALNKTYAPTTPGGKPIPLTEAVLKSPNAIVLWAETQKSLFDTEGKDWRLSFMGLVAKFDYIKPILEDKRLEWSDFLTFLKDSKSKATVLTRTGHLHTLFMKMCEPSKTYRVGQIWQ